MDTKKANIDFSYYLDLPWTYTIEQAQDENNNKIYIVRVNELPGVVTDAPTIEEAMKLIKEAMSLAFEMYLESGEEIPEPIKESHFKGNIAYRTTSRRHYLIAREAQKRNLSLSQLIDTLIDVATGKR
jgi:predicted RNase H-like HicB family nuclease